jgi:hypothetical protein
MWQPHIFSIPPLHLMPSALGPTNQELVNMMTYQSSANWDASPFTGEWGEDDCDSNESEAENHDEMNDDFDHLLNLAEAAHLVDVYHMDEDFVPLRGDLTLHDTSTPNNSP